MNAAPSNAGVSVASLRLLSWKDFIEVCGGNEIATGHGNRKGGVSLHDIRLSKGTGFVPFFGNELHNGWFEPELMDD